MSELKFICPNCEKEFTKIFHKVKVFQTLIIDFELDIFEVMKLFQTEGEHLEFSCPGCNKKIPSPLEKEILAKMNKEYPGRPSKILVKKGGIDITFKT